MNPLRVTLEQLAEQRAAAFGVAGLGDPLHYRCPEDLVLREGVAYRGAEMPAGYERGAPRQCFSNALRLAIDHPELSYCEGYGMTRDVPIPIYHAWCVDPAGRVVEPTWKTPDPNVSYLGIVFPTQLVIRTQIGRSFAGMIDNFEQRYPLLRRPLAESLAEYQKTLEPAAL